MPNESTGGNDRDPLALREARLIRNVARYIRDESAELPSHSNVRADFERWANEMLSWAESSLADMERRDLSEHERAKMWRRYDWRRVPRPARESVLLQALGDQQLPLVDLEEAVEGELFGDALGVVNLQEVARRMIEKLGELDREPQRCRRTSRFLYRRRRMSEASIAELEALYQAEG